MLSRHTRITLAAVTALAVSVTSGVAYADSSDPIGSIYAAAANHRVSPGPMLATAFCESQFNAKAKGDRHLRKPSHGLFQLSELPTGLLAHFYYVGYTDPYDAEEQADYYARVTKGDFLPGGPYPAPLHPYGIVSTKRWSCNN